MAERRRQISVINARTYWLHRTGLDRRRRTFKCIGGSGRVVFIRVELESQLPVRFFEIFIGGGLFYPQDLVVIFTALNPAGMKQIW